MTQPPEPDHDDGAMVAGDSARPSTVHPDDYLLGSGMTGANAGHRTPAPHAADHPPAPPASQQSPTAGPQIPQAPVAPVAPAEPLPPPLIAAAITAFITSAWFAIEGVIRATDQSWLLKMQQQMAATSPQSPVDLSQLSFVLLMLYGTMAVMYAVAARRLLRLSLGARFLLVVLGWVNIAMFVRMAFMDHEPFAEWIDNAAIGAVLVSLLSMPSVVRRLYAARVSAARQATMAAASAAQALRPGVTQRAGFQPHDNPPPQPAHAPPVPDAAPVSIDPSRMAPYPLQLSVHLDARPWGNGAGLRKLGKPVPDSGTIGESWEVSGHPHAESRVTNGPLAGHTLNELTRSWGEWLLGPGRQPAAVRANDGSWDWRFPLLAKFLDTSGWLSVQVHPPDRDGEPGKSEAWIVLSAEPDACVYQGFSRAVTEQEVRDAIAAGTLQDLLHSIPVRAGDLIYNPAGVVHAIGPGICLYEIQQVSDATWRLYDFHRTDRELHIEQAMQVLRLEAGVPTRPDSSSLPPSRLGLTGPDSQPVIAAEHFRVWRVRLAADGSSGCRAGGDTVALVHHVGGAPIDLVWTNSTSDRLSVGDCRVIPASVLTHGMRLQVAPNSGGSSGNATLLVVTP